MTQTGGGAPSPEGITGAGEFVAALRDLRQWSGLTYRQLAARARGAGDVLPVSTLASMLGRSTLPRREVVAALARACGLPESEVRHWTAARDALAQAGGPARTPVAPNALAVVPQQLPADVPGFVGRTAQLAELDRLGRNGTAPIGVISGMAGVGKTALAVHWAHRARVGFPDGQLYLNLRGYGPGMPLSTVEALQHLIIALGVAPQQVPAEEQQAAGLFRSLATDRRLLVLLDNAASAEQVRPLLPGAAGSAVVVTSRERLVGLTVRDGAHGIELPELGPEQAVQLLARIMGDDRVGREGEAVDELIRMCGRLPLALRIAAATINQRSRSPIADFVHRLRTGDRLATLGVPGDPQSALDVAFAHSYAGLEPTPQRLFRLLGLLPVAAFDAPTVAALAGVTVPLAETLLHRLCDSHLVNRLDDDRYGMHDLLREYAGSRCAEVEPAAERSAALRRAYESYLHHAEAAARILYPQLARLPVPPFEGVGFDSPGDAVRWLTAESENLIVVATSAARQGPVEVSWLLSSSLRGHFMSCRDMGGWQRVARAALAAAQTRGNLAAQAASHLSLGLAYVSVGDYHAAIKHCEQALRLGVEAGWTSGRTAALNALGVSHSYLGEVERAVRYLTESLDDVPHPSTAPGQAAIRRNNLGAIHILRGRLDLAEEQLRMALDQHTEQKTRRGAASALLNLGVLQHHRGDLDGARRRLTTAREIYQELHDVEGEAATLAQLARVEFLLGRPGPALAYARTAVAALRRAGDGHAEALALHALAVVRQGLGNHRLALWLQRRALRLAEETGSRQATVLVQLGVAESCLGLGRHHLAEHYARQALSLALPSGYRPFEATALRVLARVALEAGDVAAARRWIDDAVGLYRETDHRLELAVTEAVRDAMAARVR
ncbi:tetratricopeptide repeat protein [Micromonospora sp. NPDC049559]|uniref:ATP-binding protein n=1 Tax=Micromonospora sp. NPDC049559 TaxID=3155923 RepID=UPI0034298550